MDESTGPRVEEGQLLATAPPSKALEPSTFYSLYLGGLSVADRQQRLRASAILLLGGRLGLRPGELQHLHEEWIDWGRGELTVPERDPCACQQCWETARHAQRAGDGRRLREILTESTWSPQGSERTIPFGWSQRLTAVLARLCEEKGYLGLSAEAMARLVDRSAQQAEGVDAEAVDVRSLRSTAAAFFADAGFSPQRVDRLLGGTVGHTRTITQRPGGDTRKRLAALFDDTRADPGADYTLMADPEPFGREPFDPRTYDSEWRQARARSRSTEPESLRNPRPMSSAVDGALDGSDLGTRTPLDPDSEFVDETNATTQLGQWVRRRDASRRSRTANTAADRKREPQQSASTESASSSVDRAEQVAAQESEAAQQSQSTQHSRQAQQSQSTQHPQQPSGTRDGPSTENEPGGSRTSRSRETAANESTASVGDANVFDPREQLCGAPEVTLETRVACSDFADGQPTNARVFLGPNELLFVRNGDSMAPEHTRIELSAVVDQSLDYLPAQLEAAFESTVTLAYETDEGQRLAVLGLAGNRQTGFANAVFRQILSECRIVITHPARRGGRVLNTEADAGTLSVADRAVSIDVDDETDEFAIQLSDVIYFELEKQTFEEERFRSLSVRHLGETGEAVKTTIAVRDDRKHKLFQRFVRRGYQERKSKIEELTLTEEYKEVLVALYSTGDGFDISMIIDKPASELQAVLSSLGQVGLVRMSDNGAILTGLGHVVVNEKIEDVNM